MNPFKFLLGIHNHQPVGNFGHVFEESFRNCYLPYFEVLERFTHLKTSAHFSGPLWEWLVEHQPGFMQRMRDLVSAGRIELLSGGFYEPLLSTLPEEDALGQIRMMNAFLRDELGAQPRGLWLAERIWTPQLPHLLAQAEIEYTLLDDTHFFYSGLTEEKIQGYYVTEKYGSPLKVFPVSRFLRYSIPFQQPEETLDWFRRVRDEWGFRGVTYGDDGEKFGGWPGTHQWVYEEKWLERFFRALEENRDWVETTTFGEFVDSEPPQGRIYLPMASYEEMMEWSLPADMAHKYHDLKIEMEEKGIPEERFRVFLRGGQWDNFLTKYEEVNNLHKKMLYVSRKVNRLNRYQPAQAKEALTELYQGQCNCAQWHGLFGGLYLNYLRHALYQHLIEAENLVDAEVLGEDFAPYVSVMDFNLDGHDEIIYSNPELNAYLAPNNGGTVFEWDVRPANFNVCNVLTRREETYHRNMKEMAESADGEQPKSIHDRVKFKEPGLADHLVFDRTTRASFMDHFLPADTALADFKTNQHTELGDFVDRPYEFADPGRPVPGKDFAVTLRREGKVRQEGNASPLIVEKKFYFSPDEARVRVDYRLSRPEGTAPLTGLWAVEFNVTLLAGDAEDRYYVAETALSDKRLRSEGELAHAERFGMCDDWSQVHIEWELSPCTLWRFPVETISQSEDGFERNYQGSCVVVLWPVTLEPGASIERPVTFKTTTSSG